MTAQSYTKKRSQEQARSSPTSSSCMFSCKSPNSGTSGLPSTCWSHQRLYKLPSALKLPYNTILNNAVTQADDISFTSLSLSRVEPQWSHQTKLERKCIAHPPNTRQQVSFIDPAVAAFPSQDDALPSLQDRTLEPSPKRRRFQRRNSKTAAMLLSSLSEVLHDENYRQFTREEFPTQAQHENTNATTTTTTTAKTDEVLGGGLHIAEELVRQLQLRRQQKDLLFSNE
jgi:hypothetical protein